MTFVFDIANENQFSFQLFLLPKGQTNPVNSEIELSIAKVPHFLYASNDCSRCIFSNVSRYSFL